MSETTFLVIGYGNPGRGDDGLGPALATRLEGLQIPGVTTEVDYQLAIEHAALAAEHDVVIFADAATDVEGLFHVRPLAGRPGDTFSSHVVSPGQVLSLAHSCFAAAPAGYVLGMRGRTFEFGEGLTTEAQEALEASLAHLLRFIEEVRQGGRGGNGRLAAAH